MGRPPGEPTTVVSVRVPTDLLDRIDADLTRQGKANRSAWFMALAVAVLDHRLVPVAPSPPPIETAPDSARSVIGYAKADQTGKRNAR